MPLTSSANDYKSDLADLSDHDVELLHQIVLRAQQNPDVQKRPKRALFAAYETVFSENGLGTRHDRACLRIILQLGEPQIPGQLLYDKFEFVLRQLGVTLAFGDDDSATAEDENQYPLCQDEETFADGQPLQGASVQRRRRASFASTHELTNEQLRSSMARRMSRASESQLLDEREQPFLSQRRSILPAADPHNKAGRRRRFSDQQPTPNRYGLRKLHFEQSQVPVTRAPKGVRSITASDHYDRPYAARFYYRPREADLDRDAEAFDDMKSRNLQRQLFKRWSRHGREHVEYIQVLNMQAESRDFLTLKRQALDFWRSALHRKRQQAREERFFDHLYSRAGHAYDLYLLTKSFTHWIEITAGAVAKTNAARERFLFTKYFNAWNDFTVSTELKAERHRKKMPFSILRRRAAQCYHNQTNAVKVYQSNLTKTVFWRWFHEWCDRAAPRYREQQFERSTFIRWLHLARSHQSREAKVSAEHLRSLIRKVFRTWATKARIDVAGYHQADAFRKSYLLLPIVKKWSAEEKLRPLEGQVQRLRDWKVARKNFRIWQLRTRMFFHADTVNTKRITQNAFTVWNEELRSQAVAARINDRILAETTYRWVIAQRFVLMSRICQRRSRRRVASAFFKGVRQKWEQLASCEEQVEVAGRHRVLTSTFASWNRRKIACDALFQIALNFYDPKVKQDTMQAIRLKLRHQEKLERWAWDARFYFLMTKYIGLWRAASIQQRKSRERAAYGKMRKQYKMNLARNVLLTWRGKASSERAVFESSGLIYGQKIRTMQRTLLRHWQAITSQRQQDASQASTQYDSRLLSRSLHSLLDVSRTMSNMRLRAERYYHLTVSEICAAQLRRFSLRAFEIRRRDKDADAIHDRHWNRHVRNIIRHWASRARDSNYGKFLDQRNDNRNDEKALVKGKAAEETEPTDAGYGTASNDDHNQNNNNVQSSRTSINDLGITTNTRRAEEWTAFDNDLLLQRGGDDDDVAEEEEDEGSQWIDSPRPPQSPLSFPSAGHGNNNNDRNTDETPQSSRFQIATSTPTPGYLNTPSKRAARAKALADLTSTTPAVPPPTSRAQRPFVTPFMARLRSGAGHTSGSGRGRTLN